MDAIMTFTSGFGLADARAAARFSQFRDKR